MFQLPIVITSYPILSELKEQSFSSPTILWARNLGKGSRKGFLHFIMPWPAAGPFKWLRAHWNVLNGVIVLRSGVELSAGFLRCSPSVMFPGATLSFLTAWGTWISYIIAGFSSEGRSYFFLEDGPKRVKSQFPVSYIGWNKSQDQSKIQGRS